MEIFALYGLIFAFLTIKSEIFKQKTVIFSKFDSLALKGFFAIIIILHHLGHQFDLGVFSAFNAKMGGVAIGIFFLLSAYGLLKSCEQNDYKYLKRLFVTKILKLYLFQVAINFLYYLILKPSGTTIEVLIRIFNFDIFFGLGRINDFSWFTTTILFCYLGIALSLIATVMFKIKNKKIFLGVAVIFTTLVIGICLYLFPASNIYTRCLCGFILGAILFMLENKVLNILANKTTFICLVTSFSLLTILGIILLSEELTTIFACLLLVTAFKYVSLDNNKLGLFLGKISLPVYLMQYIFFVKIAKTNIWLYSFYIIAGTVISAIIITFMYELTKKAIIGIKNSLSKK